MHRILPGVTGWAQVLGRDSRYLREIANKYDVEENIVFYGSIEHEKVFLIN